MLESRSEVSALRENQARKGDGKRGMAMWEVLEQAHTKEMWKRGENEVRE